VVAQSPYALQNAAHSAALFRLATFSAFRQAGTIGAPDLVISAQTTPNMSIQVAAGRAWMLGTQLANVSGGSWTTQGGYYGYNDAPVTLTVAAADPTNPRIDLVVAYVQDAFYSGASNLLVLGIVTGTPAATPAAPAAPSNALTLGTLAVAANATSIVSGNVSPTSNLLTVARGGILPVSSSNVVAGEHVGQGRDHPTFGWQRWNGTDWGPVDLGRPFGILTGSSTTAVANATYTAVPLPTSTKLSGGVTSPAAGRLAAPRSGWYLCSGMTSFAGGLTASGRRFAGISVNGGATLSYSQGETFPSTTSGSAIPTAAVPIALNAGDYVSLMGYQDSGAAGSFDMSQSFLQLQYICPL
jgi:hypothetical protein